MTNGVTASYVRNRAKMLKQSLGKIGIEILYQNCCEVIARAFGSKNWSSCQKMGGTPNDTFDMNRALVTLSSIPGIDGRTKAARKAVFSVFKKTM